MSANSGAVAAGLEHLAPPVVVDTSHSGAGGAGVGAGAFEGVDVTGAVGRPEPAAQKSTAPAHPLVKCVRGDVVVTPTGLLRPGYVSVDPKGTISRVSESMPSDVEEDDITCSPYVIPGLVDIHNHGVGTGSGSCHEDVTTFWSHPFHTCAQVVQLGVTSVVATVTFPGSFESPDPATRAALHALADAVHQVRPGCAVVEGVHAEGPLVADLGGLPPSGYKDMTSEQFGTFLDTIPALKMLTISPHVLASREWKDIPQLVSRASVTVALGHDKCATRDEIIQAMRLLPGRVHVTHMFNVMAFHHRVSGLANLALLPSFPNVPRYKGLEPPTVELIGDNKHVSEEAVHLVLKSRSSKDVMFVSDAISVPLSGRQFTYCGRQVSVSDDASQVVLSESGIVAGSCRGLDFVFKRLMDVHGCSLMDTVRMCCENPAKRLGLQRGALVVGRRADLVLLDDEFNVRKVVVAGALATEVG